MSLYFCQKCAFSIFLPHFHDYHVKCFKVFVTDKNCTVRGECATQFPATGDVTVELGAAYLAFKVKVKVDRVTAVVTENVVKQRTSFELVNILWPFGVASTKETNRKSYTEVEVSA